MEPRRYEDENSWITFKFTANYAPLWMQLGEAFSKCQHLAGTPLKPAVAQGLSEVYLTKGALASAAIEGNTLSEDEAAGILHDNKQLPRSQAYLEQELRNIADAVTEIDQSMKNDSNFWVTEEWIREQNRKVLKDLELSDDVVPGEYSTHRMVVGKYRGAPPEDYGFLIVRLCEWLNDWLKDVNNPDTPDEIRFANAFFAATLGHLYIAWIHPFGDGNGRTARLLSCAILARSGVVPHVSSNVLSDHYNRTRSKYYQRLQNASEKGEVTEFIQYSAEGFVDMLREQISTVQEYQKKLAWANYIHEQLQDEPNGNTKERRRALALAFPTDRIVEKKQIKHLTPELAEHYATHGERMVSRDLTALINCGIIVRSARMKYFTNDYIIDAFRPLMSSNGSSEL